MAVSVSRSGGIYIEISGDYEQLRKDLGEVNRLAKDAGKDISDTLSGALSPRITSNSTTNLTRYMKTARNAAQATKADLDNMSEQFKAIGRSIGVAEKDLQSFVEMQNKMHKNQAQRAFENNLKGIKRLTGSTDEEMNKLAKSLGGLGNEFDSAGGKANLFGLGLGKVVGIAGAITAGRAAINFGIESFHLSAEYEMLESVLHQVGSVSGYTAVQVDEATVSLRKMGIAGIEARKTMSQLIQAQVDISSSSDLARIAQDAATIANLNSSQAFEKLVYGIQSGQTQVLRTMGINVNFQRAYQKLASNINKTVAELNEQERVQARVNAVSEAGELIQGTYEAAMERVGKQMSSLKRVHQDLKTDLGAFATSVAESSKAVLTYTKAIEGLDKKIVMARGRAAGLTDADLYTVFNKEGLEGVRALIEGVSSFEREIVSAMAKAKSLIAEGIDVSKQTNELDKLKGYKVELVAINDEINKLQNTRDNVSEHQTVYRERDLNVIDEKLTELRNRKEDLTISSKSLRSAVADINAELQALSDESQEASGAMFKLGDKFLDLSESIDSVQEAYKRTSQGAKEAREKQISDSIKMTNALTEQGHIAAGESKKIVDALTADLSRASGVASRTTSSVSDSGQKLKSALQDINDEILKATTTEAEYKNIKLSDKIAEYEQLGVSAEKLAKFQSAISGAEASKAFDEASRALQEFEKKYQDTFQNSRNLSASLASEMDKYRDAAKQALGETSREFAEFEARLEQLVARMREENSREFLDGASRAVRNYSEEATNAAKNIETALTSSITSVEDSLVDFVTKGKASFSDLIDSIIADFARLAIRQNITGPLFGAMGGLFGFAKGGILPSAALSDYSNSIVASPTTFAFAKGGVPNIGLMGEAGAEAIMPLKRMASGDLGIRAETGGSPQVEVNVTVENNSSSEVQVQQTPNNSGGVDIKLMVVGAVAEDINRGGAVAKSIHSMMNRNNPRGYKR